MVRPRSLGILFASLLSVSLGGLTAQQSERPIALPLSPTVSPDGGQVAFVWQGDLWVAPTGVADTDAVGLARRVTVHPASDSSPAWSPDGKSLAFVSSRAGSSQVFVVRVDDPRAASPRQVTFDSMSKALVGYHPDGERLILRRTTDVAPFRTESARLYLRSIEGGGAETMLFDCGVGSAAMSPDGQRVLFTRGRPYRTRKGYIGPQALQLWLAERSGEEDWAVRRVSEDRPGFQNVAEDFPMWKPDSRSFLYTSSPDGIDQLFEDRVPEEGSERSEQLAFDIRTIAGATAFDEGVEDPSLCAKGRILVYRHNFGLRVRDLESGDDRVLPLRGSGDQMADPVERRGISRASDIAFTSNGKQMAFVAGHDLYVMDRILKEPVRLTADIAVESDPVFAKDDGRLFFVSETDGEVDIWEAKLEREDEIWWLAEEGEVSLRKVTDDRAVERSLALSPDGEHIAYIRDSELFVMDSDGEDRRRLVGGWDAPSFDWSPDGKWLTYSHAGLRLQLATMWVVPLDGTREPYNL